MEASDWAHYSGFKADFIDPHNQQAGWQYGAEIVGLLPALIEGMEVVLIKSANGEYIAIPIEIAPTLIILHSQETPIDLIDV